MNEKMRKGKSRPIEPELKTTKAYRLVSTAFKLDGFSVVIAANDQAQLCRVWERLQMSEPFRPEKCGPAVIVGPAEGVPA